jgi:hypothetical protein
LATQIVAAADACSSCAIAGSATLTIEPSKTANSVPTISTSTAQRRSAPGKPSSFGASLNKRATIHDSLIH